MGFLSLKKKGSTVFVLHQLKKEGLNSNAKAIRHRGGTGMGGVPSETDPGGQVVSDSKPAPRSEGAGYLRRCPWESWDPCPEHLLAFSREHLSLPCVSRTTETPSVP